jgi:hypothetical protein
MGVLRDHWNPKVNFVGSAVGSVRQFTRSLGISARKLEAMDLRQLAAIPWVKKHNLNPCGGHIRFPGSEMQDVKFTWQTTRPGPFWLEGELYIGRGDGDNYEIAALLGIAVFWEMIYLRRTQTTMAETHP